MRRFEFRLEAVLRYRRLTEDLRKREFAMARAAVVAQEGEIGRIRSEAESARVALRDVVAGGLDLRRVLDFQRFINGQRAREARGLARLRELAAAMEPRRQAYVEARKATRALERVRERQRAGWRLEALREERRDLDEVANRAVVLQRIGEA
ncbi:MAG: flagellar export protein FliJ [Planctomycetes bacterium]|nr:flagellar export protein FliJ [Planctomycetota bacterium]